MLKVFKKYKNKFKKLSAKRKNRKIKFSEDNYIQKYYMKNKKAYIPVELESADDLYMKHDFKKMELADSVCEYIEEIATMVPVDNDVVLEIHCPEVSEEIQNKIKKCIKNNYGMEIDEIDYEKHEANKKSIWMLIMGIILLIINVLVDNKFGANSVLSNFLCVVWWVAIWDMIEIHLLDNGDRRVKRLNYQQLYDSQVTFVFDGQDEDEIDN